MERTDAGVGDLRFVPHTDVAADCPLDSGRTI